MLGCLFFWQGFEKSWKNISKKEFFGLKKLRKSIKEDKTFLAEEKKEIEAKLETENLSEEDKEELIAELQKIAENFSKSVVVEQKVDKYLKE